MAGFFEDEEDEDIPDDEEEDKIAQKEWEDSERSDPDREYDDSDSGDADLWWGSEGLKSVPPKRLTRDVIDYMKKKKIKIGNIPALLYGITSEKLYIFVHGGYGKKEDADDFFEKYLT